MQVKSCAEWIEDIWDSEVSTELWLGASLAHRQFLM